MIKNIIGITVYSYIAIYVTQAVIGGFVFDGDKNITLLLFLLALSVLNFFALPLFNILSLPHRGPGALFLLFILNLVFFYLLTVFLPNFSIAASTVSELIIFGFVLPSKSLSTQWSVVFSALLFVVILSFLKWLGTAKKK